VERGMVPPCCRVCPRTGRQGQLRDKVITDRIGATGAAECCRGLGWPRASSLPCRVRVRWSGTVAGRHWRFGLRTEGMLGALTSAQTAWYIRQYGV
jgi:hypothetical protein